MLTFIAGRKASLSQYGNQKSQDLVSLDQMDHLSFTGYNTVLGLGSRDWY